MSRPLEPASGLFEDRLDVLEHLARLRLDALALERRLAGREPELAGDEDETAGDDRLVVGRALEGRRRRLGANDLLARQVPSPLTRQAASSATPSALKIASSTCWVSRPSTRRTCSVIPAASASSLQEASGQIAGETADMCGREIEVGDQAGIVAEIERDVRERLRRGHVCAAVTARSPARMQRRERAPERLPGLGHLRIDAAGSDSEREVEAPVAGELLQQPVEHRNAGLDVSLASRRPGSGALRCECRRSRRRP